MFSNRKQISIAELGPLGSHSSPLHNNTCYMHLILNIGAPLSNSNSIGGRLPIALDRSGHRRIYSRAPPRAPKRSFGASFALMRPLHPLALPISIPSQGTPKSLTAKSISRPSPSPQPPQPSVPVSDHCSSLFITIHHDQHKLSSSTITLKDVQ